MRTSFDEKNEILSIFLDRLQSHNRLIEEYRHRPIEYLAHTGSYYPPKLERMFTDVYGLRMLRAQWIGPRGGGKTYTVGDLAASMFLFRGFDVLIASGGEGQAKEVYEVVMDDLGEEEAEEYVPSMTTQITTGRDGNWIRFIPASTRRARGPHPGRGHGGLIILDEEGEMDGKIVKAVLGTGSTAKPLVIIRASTAHNIAGKGTYHPNSPEKARLIVETADAGIIDARNSLCLIQEHPEGGWNYIPVKHTDDYGMIAKTAYRIGPKRKKELMKKLESARKRHGI